MKLFNLKGAGEVLIKTYLEQAYFFQDRRRMVLKVHVLHGGGMGDKFLPCVWLHGRETSGGGDMH